MVPVKKKKEQQAGEKPKPHDAYFKVLLAQRGVAEALLREFLPPEDLALLRPETARLVEADFIDDHLNQSAGDRVLRVESQAGPPAFFALEHKSRAERKVAWQLHGYVTRIYEWWLRQKGNGKGPLPRVYAMVVYHGAPRWRAPRTLAGLMANPHVQSPALFDFRYLLANLGARSDKKMPKHLVLRAGGMALKYAKRPAEEQAGALETVFQALEGAPGILRVTFSYIVATFDVEYAEILKVARRHFPKEEPMFRSAADRLKEEGEARGEARGKADTLMRLLVRRFGQVPRTAERRVRQAAADQLDTWLDRILDAKSVKDALADS